MTSWQRKKYNLIIPIINCISLLMSGENIAITVYRLKSADISASGSKSLEYSNILVYTTKNSLK